MVAFVYVVSGQRGALHVDVAMSLMRAMWMHKTGATFGADTRLDKLVYYERCHNIRDAHARKDELGAVQRPVLAALVERRNPEWVDLSAHWFPITATGLPAVPGAVVEFQPGKITVH